MVFGDDDSHEFRLYRVRRLLESATGMIGTQTLVSALVGCHRSRGTNP